MRLKPSRTATLNARAKLPKMAEKYFRAGREACDERRTPAEMHKFRLATKRFRYALEIFRPVYGPGLERYLSSLHELQTTLGKLSDYRSIGDLLDGDKAVEEKLKHSTEKHLKEFHEQWKAFDAEGQLKRWKTYLSGEAANARAARKPRTTPAPR